MAVISLNCIFVGLTFNFQGDKIISSVFIRIIVAAIFSTEY